MIKLIVIFVLLYIVYGFFKSLLSPTEHNSRKSTSDNNQTRSSEPNLKRTGHVRGAVDDEDAEDMEKDPICGAYFNPSDGVSIKEGRKTIHFCSDDCKDEFLNKSK